MVTLVAADDGHVGQHVAEELERARARRPLEHKDVRGGHLKHHLTRGDRGCEAAGRLKLEHRLCERVVNVDDARRLGRLCVARERERLHIGPVVAPRVVGPAWARKLARRWFAAQQRQSLHLRHVARWCEAH